MDEGSVAVIGAGIGGLSSALAFERSGVPVRVYEQSEELSEVGAGIGLWPGAVRSLEHMGVSPAFWDLRAAPFRWAETATPDGRVLTGFDVTGMTAGAPGFVVRRSDLHWALVDSLSASNVVLGRRLTGLRQEPARVVLEFADGSVDSAAMVVGADGLGSTVRALLHGSRPARYSGETCYRGLCEMAVADTGILREVQGPGQRCAVHPIDDAHVYWWATRRAEPGLEEGPELRKELLTELFAGWQFGFPQALAATPAQSILKNDLFDRPALKQWSRGRVTLLGDAAHPTTPNLGLGGCMAIEDALVLARSYRENAGDVSATFHQYEAERRRRTASVVRMSAAFGRMGSLRSPLLIRGREALTRLTPTAVSRAMFARQVAFDPGPLVR